MIERLLKLRQLFLDSDPEWRCWFLAFVVVPVGVISYVASGFRPISPLSVFEDGISVVSMHRHSADSAEGVSTEGALLIVDPLDVELALPWLNRADRVDMFSSIAPAQFEVNDSRIQLDEQQLRMTMPMLGITEPVAVFASGVQAREVLLPGRRLKVSSLGLPPRSSLALTLWALLSAVFGIGLALGSAPTSQTNEERARQQRTEKRKNQIVNRDTK